MNFWEWFAPAWIALLLIADAGRWYLGEVTLSSTIRKASKEHPLLPFGLGGAVVGLAFHFWGS